MGPENAAMFGQHGIFDVPDFECKCEAEFETGESENVLFWE